MRLCGEDAPAPLARGVSEESGQMVVEFALVVPVMIVMALVTLNIMWFLEAASRFDRVAPDAVLAVAVSPAGDAVGAGREHAVCDAVTRAMSGLRGVEVRVESSAAWQGGGAGGTGTFAPFLTRYTCTMYYTPWPSGLTIGGIDMGAPLRLEHSKSVVVDGYRPGIVF